MASDSEQHLSELQAHLSSHSITWEVWNDSSNPQQYSSEWSGIVFAHAGIAETGSLVFWHDAQQPQVISSAPHHLIVCLKQSAIKNQFLELVEGIEWAHPPPSISIITGDGKRNILGTSTILTSMGPQIIELIIINSPATPSTTEETATTIVAPNLTLQ